jgi:lycopene beta-cyclase
MKIAPVALLLTAQSSLAFVSQRVALKRVTKAKKSVYLATKHTNFWKEESGTSIRRSLSTTTLFSSDTSNFDEVCDVLVLGSGPAGRAIASLLAQKDLSVTLADSNYDRTFPPNYGVWKDEWQAVVDRYQAGGVSLEGGSVGSAINREWQVTDCFFGGSFDIPVEERTRLDRPYQRVDRNALRSSLSDTGYKVLYANHVSKAISLNLYSPAGSLVHDEDGTTILLKGKNGLDTTVRTKLVIDATGHETQLVLRDTRAPANNPPGFQIAYGATVELDESNIPSLQMFGPYDKEAMTLFDYRTDHFDDNEVEMKKGVTSPTFMYCMPLEGNKVFFEETSLVARPGVSFQECKDRFDRRLKYLGITPTKVEEEEFCYIPMGGSLPCKDQRVIGVGGAAAMVHPSTGYHLCRMMMGACDMAETIEKELKASAVNLDRAAANSYHSIWKPENIRQRNFAVFGGEFLMQQNVVGLRGFFDGFFRLPVELWGGFLAGWPGLPNNDKHESWLGRIWFGLNFIIRIPPAVAFPMLWAIISYTITEGAPLPQSVTPLFGEPPSYEYQDALKANVGDVACKIEARTMIIASRVEDVVPVAFEEEESMQEQNTFQ